MDWMSILNQCLDVILPAVASVIAILFGVLGAKIKQIYNEISQNETVGRSIKNCPISIGQEKLFVFLIVYLTGSTPFLQRFSGFFFAELHEKYTAGTRESLGKLFSC